MGGASAASRVSQQVLHMETHQELLPACLLVMLEEALAAGPAAPSPHQLWKQEHPGAPPRT